MARVSRLGAIASLIAWLAPCAAADNQWMIELDGPPAAVVWAQQISASGASSGAPASTAAVAASRQQSMANEQAQALLLAALAESVPAAREVFRVQKVLNGVAVRLPEGGSGVSRQTLAAVRRLPGVRRLRPMPTKQRTNATSVPFLGSAQLWDAGGGGLTGDGLTIGIIDTGVDYLHTDFGGSGLAADYASNDTTVLDAFFPSAKVAGGFDFVGDAYDASSADPMISTPQPDPDPMDCEGHGTHVAGTAAGFGVRDDGTTFPGPYDLSVPFGDLRIGPGVAPAAKLYALRVFGCGGDSNVVELALEWAIDPDDDGDFSDHLDVVNLSLASRFGGADDPTAEAADNAALLGVVVVASAGNDGDVTSIVGTPASADRAIAVAATWDDETSFPTRAVRILSPAPLAGTHQAGGANFGPPVTPPGLTAGAGLADPLDACSPLVSPLPGLIAVLRRDDGCSFVTQTRHAQDAGAVAVVIVNDRPELQGVFNDGTGGDIVIPPVMIRQQAGEPLVDEIESGGTATLTVTSSALADMAALFSSRGPRRGGAGPESAALKPDLAAPGVIITSALLGNGASGGTGATIKSGTSMSAPHVAGLAALVLERRPGYSPADVKAALVNTGRDVFLDPEDTPPRMSTSRMGGGRVRAVPAAATDTLAYRADRPEQVGLAFGHFELVDTVSAEGVLRVDHRGPGTATFEVSLDVVDPLSGVTASLPGGSSLVVPAGGSAEVLVRVELEASLLRHQRDPAQEATLFGLPRHWPSEWTAYAVFEPSAGSAPTLRVPLHLSARAASSMAAAGSLEVGAAAIGTASLELTGTGVDSGVTPPLEERSLVSVLELLGAPEPDPALPAALDIAYVGAATDAAVTGLAGATFYVGLATRGPLSTPLEARFEVLIDVDQDAVDDYLLFSSDEGSFAFGSFATDGFITVLRDLATEAESRQLPLEILGPGSWHSAPFHTDVRLLAVRAADLGLLAGAAEVGFSVRVAEGLGGTVIADRPGQAVRGRSAVAGPFTFDLERPGLDAAGGLPAMPLPAPIHFDLGGAAVPVAFELAALAGRQLPGLLLLHHHNAAGRRAETVALVGDLPDLRLDLLASPDPVGPDGVVVAAAELHNVGAEPAAAVELRLQLPADSFFEPAFSDPSCALDLGEVSCVLGDLAAGGQRSLAVAFGLTGAALGSRVRILGEATTSSFEGDRFDNRASAEVLVSGVLLSLTKTAAGAFTDGSVVLYSLELRNLGALDQPDLAGPELIDLLPAELELLGAASSAGLVVIDPPARTVTWSGALAAGSGVSIEIVAAVAAAPGTSVVNQAQAVFDAGGDGVADGEVVSDDPAVAGSDDPTVFVVAPAIVDVPAVDRVGLSILVIVLILVALRIRRRFK